MKNKKENKSAEAVEKRLEKERKSEFITKLSLIFTILGTFTTFIENELVKFWLKIIFFIILSYTILNLFFFEGYKNIKNMVNRFLQKPLFKKILFVLVIIISIAIMLVLVNFINRFFEKDKIGKHFDLLKLMNENNLIQSENNLNKFSNESIDIKIGVLEKILSKCDENDRESFKIEIMPIVYHAMIGLEKKNYKDILDFALEHLNEKNWEKVLFLFKKQYFDFALKGESIKKFQDLLDNKYPLGQSKNVWFHKFVVSALKEMGDKTEIKILKELAEKSENTDVLINVAETLGRFGEKNSLNVIEKIKNKTVNKNINIRITKILGEIGDENSTNLLINFIIKYEHFEVKENAVFNLGKLGNKVADQFIKFVNHKHYSKNSQKKYIINALGEIKDKRAVPYLMNVLKTNSGAEIQLNAIDALGKIKCPEAVDSLIKYLEKNDQELMKKAVWALGQIGDKRAIKPLVRVIEKNDDKLDVITIALEALGNIDDENTSIQLETLMNNKLNIMILSGLSGEFLRKFKNSNIIEMLNQRFKNPENLNIKIIELLGKIQDESAVDLLVKVLKNENYFKMRYIIAISFCYSGKIATNAVSTLISFYKNEKNYFRKYIFAHAILKIDPLNYDFKYNINEIIKNPFFYSYNSAFEDEYKNVAENFRPLYDDYDLYFPQSFIPPNSNIAKDMINIIEYAAKEKERMNELPFDGNFWKMLDWWEAQK